MELKYAHLLESKAGMQVSIVPLWNWNSLTIGLIVIILMFQSYLYGIEMNLEGKVKNNQYKFQSYLYGIEITSRDGSWE